MTKNKKLTALFLIFGLLIGLAMISFIWKPAFIKEIFTVRTKGLAITPTLTPQTDRYTLGGSTKPDQLGLSTENTSSMVEMQKPKEWESLTLAEQKTFFDLADDLILRRPFAGLKILPFSNQDKSINKYYAYAAKRIQTMENPERLHGDWLEATFKRLPLWMHYAYAYERKKEAKIVEDVFSSVLQGYKEKEITLFEVVAYLNTFERYPLTSVQALPKIFFLIDNEMQRSIRSQNPTEQVMAFACNSILRKNIHFEKFNKPLHDIMLQYTPNTDFTLRVQETKLLLSALYYYKEAGGLALVPEGLLKTTQKLAYELMMILEPDGCLPQLGNIKKRVNSRESLFYATKIFDTNDLRFVAFGGLRNLDANPPLKNEIYLKELGYFASKSTWNITDLIPELAKGQEYDRLLGADASQITIDAQSQEISFYAYSKPLVKVNLKGSDLSASTLSVSRAQKKIIDGVEYIVDELKLGSNTELLFIRALRVVVIHNTNPNLVAEIKSYRSQFSNDYTLKTIKTVHKVSPTVFYNSTHYKKHQGDCYLKGEFTLKDFDDSQTEHEEEGYFNLVRLTDLKYLILEGKPFLLPDMEDRMFYGDSRVHEVVDASIINGELKIKKRLTHLTVGRLKTKQK